MEPCYAVEVSASILKSALLDFRHHETDKEINNRLDIIIAHANAQSIDDPAISRAIHKGPYYGPLLHEVLWNCGHYRMSSASGLSWVSLLLERGANPLGSHLDMGPLGILVAALRQSVSQAADMMPLAKQLVDAGADPWNGLSEQLRALGVDGIGNLLVAKQQPALASFLMPLMHDQVAKDEVRMLDASTVAAVALPRRGGL
jgi:hypothetical protein